MQLAAELATLQARKFQSSPGPKAGCNPNKLTKLQQEIVVSILTRPESRMQLLCIVCTAYILQVSILTRPESRMQQNEGELFNLSLMFQSSPGPKAGCNSKQLAL